MPSKTKPKYFEHDSSIGTCKYASFRSITEQTSNLPIDDIKSQIFGKNLEPSNLKFKTKKKKEA